MEHNSKRFAGFGLILILFFFLTISTEAQRQSVEMANPQEYVPGELLVKLVPGIPAQAAEQARQAVGARVVKTFRRIGVEHWRLGRGISVERALEILSRSAEHRRVEYAEPNYIVHADSVFPGDPFRAELWGLHNLGQTGGIKDADIDAPDAWQLQQGSYSVVVGVIDTGIDYTHPDLATNIWTNPGEIPGNGVDDDGNGYVDDVHGWDFFNDDNDPMDDNGHGTHTAGTIGAVGDNGIGVAGVSWRVKLMALKFLSGSGSGPSSAAISAILYATSFGVPITNNSWGGGRRSNALQDAIASSGALFVASAGNSASSSKQYPAGYALENIISVAATDHGDLLASFSNFGNTWVHLGAPGVDIYSTAPNSSYQFMSGTSMAAPHVAGTAALVLAQFPGASALEMKSRILNSVDWLPSLTDKTSTGGRLNAARAVGAAPAPPSDTTPPASVTDLTAGAVTSDSVVLSWHTTGDDGMTGIAYLYDVRFSTSPLNEATWSAATPAQLKPLPQTPGSLESFTLQGLLGGTTYHFAIKVADEEGNFSVLSNVAVATTAPSVWVAEVIDVGTGSFGAYHGVTFGPDGAPVVAYSDDTNDLVKFAGKVGPAWQVETVDIFGATGISLAFDPNDGNPSISYGWGKLRFAHRTGSSWQIQTLEKSGAQNDVTSMAYDPSGHPAISYRVTGKHGALKLARWSGSSWNLEIVDQGAGARYSSLAFGPDGNPAIAYSDDIDGDNWLESLKYAHWNGSSWEIEVVETGKVGYGVTVSLAFDPAGRPCIVHFREPMRFLCKEASGWTIPETVGSGRSATLRFNFAGEALVAYEDDGYAFARRTSTGWQAERIQAVEWTRIIKMTLDPAGRAATSYGDPANHKMYFAQRQAP